MIRSGAPSKKVFEGSVFLIVLDGVGIGELPDAGRYGDSGSNTLAHVAEAAGGLTLPNLGAMGLGRIGPILGVPPVATPGACYGRMAESAAGKDSTTGHWEIAGLVSQAPMPTYPDGFPPELMERFLQQTGCAGFLGNKAASGTAIIQELGAWHMATGFPIVYTSADSVFQIAAHEEVIPLARLWEICERTRREVCVGPHAVGRVIARPFLGRSGSFQRTAHRHDYSLAPSGPTLLDILAVAKVGTITIGKVDDLFASRSVSRAIHTRDNDHGMAEILQLAGKTERSLVFANLVDFDALYGHRNDPAGFARALERFDAWLPELVGALGERDWLFITADHGNDPTTPSTDHSREYVPLLAYQRRTVMGIDLGTRRTFADLGRSIARIFGVGNELAGESFVEIADAVT